MMKHTRQKDIDLFVEMGKSAERKEPTQKPKPRAPAQRPRRIKAPAAKTDAAAQ